MLYYLFEYLETTYQLPGAVSFSTFPLELPWPLLPHLSPSFWRKNHSTDKKSANR